MSKVFKTTINDTTTILKELNVSFDKMQAILPEIEKKTLQSGAMALKEKVKEAFIAKLPSASNPIRKPYRNYTGTPLTEGVRQSKVDERSNTVTVHILGSHGQDMTWLTRMYENETKPRYQKTYKGKKLRKKRYTGKLRGYHFFEPTIQTNIESVTQQMTKTFENKINSALDGQ